MAFPKWAWHTADKTNLWNCCEKDVTSPSVAEYVSTNTLCQLTSPVGVHLMATISLTSVMQIYSRHSHRILPSSCLIKFHFCFTYDSLSLNQDSTSRSWPSFIKPKNILNCLQRVGLLTAQKVANDICAVVFVFIWKGLISDIGIVRDNESLPVPHWKIFDNSLKLL